MDYQNPYEDQSGSGSGNDDGAGPDTSTPNSGTPYQGIPPPWYNGSGIVPFAPGKTWQDYSGGRLTDPEGNTWNWDRTNGAVGGWVKEGSSPPSAPSGGGGGGTPSGGTPFEWPTFTGPSFKPSVPLTGFTPYTPTPFSYADYKLPTLEEAQNQPGYKFGLQEGQDAAANAAAKFGTLRGGGFLKDLFKYTNAAGEQNYGNVVSQGEGAYNLNRGNAFNNWQANEGAKAAAAGFNWQGAKDENTSLNQGNQQDYTNAYQNAVAEFNPKFQSASLSFADNFNRWLAKLNSLTQLSRPV